MISTYGVLSRDHDYTLVLRHIICLDHMKLHIHQTFRHGVIKTLQYFVSTRPSQQHPCFDEKAFKADNLCGVKGMFASSCWDLLCLKHRRVELKKMDTAQPQTTSHIKMLQGFEVMQREYVKDARAYRK